MAKAASRPVGICPEIKSPGLINTLDILRNPSQRFEDIVLEVLKRYIGLSWSRVFLLERGALRFAVPVV